MLNDISLDIQYEALRQQERTLRRAKKKNKKNLGFKTVIDTQIKDVRKEKRRIAQQKRNEEYMDEDM